MDHRPSNAQSIACSEIIPRSIFGFNLTFLWTFLVLTLSGLTVEAQVSREYQLKSVFLFNFAQFTDWPESAFTDDKSPIIIGVLGTDPFGRAFEDTVKDENVRGRPLVVEHYRRGDEIKTCHILFISQSETRRMDEIVRSLKGKPILTVADADGPSTMAVIIRFAVENNKVHFRVNQETAAAANLTLSSRLLRVADATPAGKAP